jgi:hypothetical protein
MKQLLPELLFWELLWDIFVFTVLLSIIRRIPYFYIHFLFSDCIPGNLDIGIAVALLTNSFLLLLLTSTNEDIRKNLMYW